MEFGRLHNVTFRGKGFLPVKNRFDRRHLPAGTTRPNVLTCPA